MGILLMIFLFDLLKMDFKQKVFQSLGIFNEF